MRNNNKLHSIFKFKLEWKLMLSTNQMTEPRLRVCVTSSLNMADMATVFEIGSTSLTNCSWLFVNCPPYLKLRRKLERMLFAESLFLTKDLRRKSRVSVKDCREDDGLLVVVVGRVGRVVVVGRVGVVGRVVSVSSVSVMVGKWYSGGRSGCRSTLSLSVMGMCDVSSVVSVRFDVIL